MDEDVLASPASSAPPRSALRVAAGGAASGRSAPVSFDDFFRSELPRLRALARALCGSALAGGLHRLTGPYGLGFIWWRPAS